LRHRIDGFQTVQTSLVLALSISLFSLSLSISLFYLPFLYHPHTRKEEKKEKLFERFFC
jgi:cytochrome c-type biogenesis protein CcmE